jgi:transposase
MRKSIDGLSGLVTLAGTHNPLSGDVYVFINRRGDKIKLLVWEGDGFWLLYKRLEKGTFDRPYSDRVRGLYDLSCEELIFLLGGIEMRGIKRRKRLGKNKIMLG